MARSTLLATRLVDFFNLHSSSSRLLPMEGLRGVAVILVFFVHFHEAFNGYLPVASLSAVFSDVTYRLGHCGVDLFFVISGYLIYGATLRDNRSFSYLTFIRRRVQRIYPTYLAVVALYLVLSVCFPKVSRLPSGVFPLIGFITANVFLLPGLTRIPALITVSWSLSYELLFYLTVPLLVVFCRFRKLSSSARLGLIFLLGITFLGYCLLSTAGHSVLRFAAEEPHLRMSMFLVGMLVYELLAVDHVERSLKPSGELGVLLLLVASGAALYLIRVYSPLVATFPGMRWAPGIYELGIISSTCICLTLYAFGFHGILYRLFSHDSLRALGNMSYSYYLIHGVTVNGIQLALQHLIPREPSSLWVYWSMLPLTFGATLTTSAVLYGAIERRFSITSRRTGKEEAPSRHQKIAVAR